MDSRLTLLDKGSLSSLDKGTYATLSYGKQECIDVVESISRNKYEQEGDNTWRILANMASCVGKYNGTICVTFTLDHEYFTAFPGHAVNSTAHSLHGTRLTIVDDETGSAFAFTKQECFDNVELSCNQLYRLENDGFWSQLGRIAFNTGDYYEDIHTTITIQHNYFECFPLPHWRNLLNTINM